MTLAHWSILTALVAVEIVLQFRAFTLRRARRRIFERYSSVVPSYSKAEDSEGWLARASELEELDRIAAKTPMRFVRLLELILIGAFVFAFFL